MTEVLWRVYLADESVFDSTMGGPDDVPRHPRVVCLSQWGNPNFRAVLTNGDWYAWREDLQCWTQHDDMGMLLEFIDHAPVIGAVRAAKYCDDPTFKALWARARADAGVE